MKKLCGAFIVSMVLAACAGTPFKFDNARQVKIGMTEKDLTNLMGPPYMVTARGEDQVWIWSAATAFGSSKSVSFVLRDGKVASVPVIPESFK